MSKIGSKFIQEIEGIVGVIDEIILELKQIQFAKNLPTTIKEIIELERAKSLVKEVAKELEAR
jgi:hypothetical protein